MDNPPRPPSERGRPRGWRCAIVERDGCPGARAGRYAAFSFFARRASRYALILALGRSLCLEQTIPKTGAAGLLQPGTGQSCFGPFRRAFRATAILAILGGRPGPRLPPPKALSTATRARPWACRSRMAA